MRCLLAILLLLPGLSAQLLDRVVVVLEERFYDQTIRARLPALAAPFQEAAAAAGSLAGQRAVVHAFLGTIPASHLALYSRSTWRRLEGELAGKRAPTFGVQLVAVGGRFFVHDVLDGGPAARAGLVRGDRVLTIDGEPTGASARLDARADDAALPDLPVHDLLCDSGDTVRFTVESRPSSVREVDIVSASYSALLAAAASVHVLERSGRSIGYLHLRYMHHTGVTKLVGDALVRSFAGCEGVVLDLRGRGGNAATVTALVRLLENREPRVPLAFLIDSETRSAKEMLAREIRQRRLGRLVGERTAGAFLPASFEDVGSDSVLMFPAASLGQLTREIEGRGVAPDVEASSPLEYSQGSDPILEAALRLFAQ